MRFGFGIYIAWTTAASILNVAQALYKWGLNERTEHMVWTEVGWSILEIFISILIYAFLIIRHKDPIIGFTAIWVYVAIINKHSVVYIKLNFRVLLVF